MSARSAAPSGKPAARAPLAAMLGLVVVCLAAAAALTALSRSAAQAPVVGEELSLLVQRIPFEAQNALRGEPSAFDALGKSAARFKTLTAAAEFPDPGMKLDPAWGKFEAAAAAVRRCAAGGRDHPGGQPETSEAGAQAALGARRSGECRGRSEARSA